MRLWLPLLAVEVVLVYLMARKTDNDGVLSDDAQGWAIGTIAVLVLFVVSDLALLVWRNW